MFTAQATRLDAVELYLHSRRDTPKSLLLTLGAADKLGDFTPTQVLASAEAQVPPGSTGWVRFDVSAELQAGRFYYVWLPATDGLQWELYPREIAGTARAYGGPKWHTMPHCYKHRLVPGGEPVSADGPADTYQLLPANVVNGWNRAVHGVPHSWAPSEQHPGPHWLQLDFGKAVDICEVHVTFQLPRMAAKAYDLAVPQGQSWHTVCSVRDNTLRRRIDRFEPVRASRLRLTLQGNQEEAKLVRICEVRAYGE